MKRLLQHILGTLLFLLTLAGMTLTVQAEEQSKELMVLPRQANIVVSINYETEVPDITLISPDNTAYSEAAGNVTVDHGDNILYFYLPDALAGQWLIRYDKKTNPSITANYIEYTPSLTIESLSLQGVENRQAEILFNASYPKDITYNYVVYAVLLDESRNVTGQRELDHGTARANKDEVRKVSLNNLSSYDNYFLELEVYFKEYAIETNDTRITEQNFGYVNDHQPEAMSGVHVIVDPASRLFTMDWSDYKVSCDQYLAAYYTDASPDTPIDYQSLDNNYTSAVFDVPPEVHSLTVELVYTRNGVASAPYRRQIDWEQGLTLSIDTPENTNSVQAVITYETDAQRNAVIAVNDVQQQVVLTGSDSISIQLEEFSNEVSVLCSLDDMTDVIYRKSVYSDRIAPILRFYEKVDSISVAEDRFLLTGETEPGCKLTVNGTEYPLGEEGSFSVDLALEKAENIFAVISTDPAGNQSAQNITIYHGDVPAAAAMAAGQDGGDSDMGYLPMFFTMLVGMSAVLVLILTGVVLGKRRGLARGVMTVTTLRNVALLITLFLSAAAAFARLLAERARQAAESLAFIRAAQRSPQEAHNMLKEYESLHKVFLTLAIAAGLCLLIAILLMVLNRVLKKRKPALQGPDAAGGRGEKPGSGPLPGGPTGGKKAAKKAHIRGKASAMPPEADHQPSTAKSPDTPGAAQNSHTGANPGPAAAEPDSHGTAASAPKHPASSVIPTKPQPTASAPRHAAPSAGPAKPQPTASTEQSPASGQPAASGSDRGSHNAEASQNAASAVFCPHCGKLVTKSNAMFCPFCGKSLRS
ncbi:MAG: zinc-ribbon domain-containing protein [Enterocloster asparagiformis]|nr:zinc-ribbon domain-containing protein [Enterocloster asparagiformis]